MLFTHKAFANFLITVLAITGIIIYFLQPSDSTAQRTLKIDLKDATFDFAINNDALDVNLFLKQLVAQKQYREAVKGILNANGYYHINDTALVDALDKEPASNPLVRKLRMSAASYTSIFSNDLRPTVLTVTNNIATGVTEGAACRRSEYFGKNVLLSNREEDIFYITKIVKPWACSDDENKIYVTEEVARYISGCKPLANNNVPIKVQRFSDTEFPKPERLCNS